MWVASRMPRCSTLRIITRNHARIIREIDFQRRAELEKATLDWIVNEIYSGFQVMAADGLREVIPELPLFLNGLLRNVRIGTKRCVREYNEWGADRAVYQIVPILVAKRKLVDGRI